MGVTYTLDGLYTFSKKEVKQAEKEFGCKFSKIDDQALSKWVMKNIKERKRNEQTRITSRYERLSG